MADRPGVGFKFHVTSYGSKGNREHMEDMVTGFHKRNSTDNEMGNNLSDLEWSYFGVFDGHGGPEAAKFAQKYLLNYITRQANFYSNNDEDVLRAIKDGFLNIHYAMWRDLYNWPKRSSGILSTSGTTATVAFIMKHKIYIGHLGDTAAVLGYQEDGVSKWKAKLLTKDHKPDCEEEKQRIEQSGGKVIIKYGVPRVLLESRRPSHVRSGSTSNLSREIPILSVSRSLGDFWSYNSALDKFVVSPVPDVSIVYQMDKTNFRCLILGSDGLWNMVNPEKAIAIVQETEKYSDSKQVKDQASYECLNPSKVLVGRAQECYMRMKLEADNISVITVIFDPPEFTRDKVFIKQISNSQEKNHFSDDISEKLRAQTLAIDTLSDKNAITTNSTIKVEQRENNLLPLSPILSVKKHQDEKNQTLINLNVSNKICLNEISEKSTISLNYALSDLSLSNQMYCVATTRSTTQSNLKDKSDGKENKAIPFKNDSAMQTFSIGKVFKFKGHSNVPSSMSKTKSKASGLYRPMLKSFKKSNRMLRSGTLVKALRSRNIYCSISQNS